MRFSYFVQNMDRLIWTNSAEEGSPFWATLSIATIYLQVRLIIHTLIHRLKTSTPSCFRARLFEPALLLFNIKKMDRSRKDEDASSRKGGPGSSSAPPWHSDVFAAAVAISQNRYSRWRLIMPCKAKHIQMLKQIYKVDMYLLVAHLFTIKVLPNLSIKLWNYSMRRLFAFSSIKCIFSLSYLSSHLASHGVLGFWGFGVMRNIQINDRRFFV